MPLTIINNPNSFVQFGAADSFTHCVFGEVRQCLPVYDSGDLSFQILVDAGNSSDAALLCELGGDAVLLEIMRDCDDAVPVATAGDVFETVRIGATVIAFNFHFPLPGFPYSLKDGECFYLRASIDASPFLLEACSNCMQRITNDCFTSVIKYRCDEDAFGFVYCGADSFYNSVRLPFYMTKPQYPAERNVFRKANGVTKVLSSVIRKTVQGITDYMQESWHQKLVIALNSDIVWITADNFNEFVAVDGDYSISWQDFLDYPVAQANFQMQVTPFNARNTNCATCGTGFSLNDDFIAGMIGAGTTVTQNVVANDAIACCPFTCSITYINPAFVSSASIDNDGNFTAHILGSIASGDNVKIATYKVVCGDGSEAEANIYGNLEGSAGTYCCEPYLVQLNYFGYLVTWHADCVPAGGFAILIAKGGMLVYTTNVAGSQLYFYLPSVITNNAGDYRISIISICGADNTSDAAILDFTIPPAGQAPVMAQFGDTEEDCCSTMQSMVWITGGTSIAAGVHVYIDIGLINIALGNFIAGVDGHVRTMVSGVVGGLTGGECS